MSRPWILVVTLLTGALLTGADAHRDTRVLTVVSIGDLSGTAKSFGTNSRAALEAAIADINRRGGVRLADGAVGQFALTATDDHCQPDEGAVLLRRAADSPALVVIGPSCSAVAERLYGGLQRHVDDAADTLVQMPVFTEGAMKADLTRVSEWAFRNTPNESDMYQSLWAWVRRTYPNLRTVYGGEEADFAHSHATWTNIMAPRAREAGFTVSGQVAWSINDTNFTAPAAQAVASGADILVLSSHARTTCGMLRALARQRVRPRLVIGLTSAATEETVVGCGVEADGLTIPTSFAVRSPEARAAAQAVERSGGVADQNSMAAWEIMMTLAHVIAQAPILGRPETVAADRHALRAALAQLTTMPGLLGTIQRTSDRESRKPFVFVRVQLGEWQVIDPQS